MPKHNSENERIKRMYFTHLKAARGLSEASIDGVAKAIHRFESSTGFRSLKKFHVEQAIAFRRRLDEAVSEREGKPLSKATVLQTLNALRAFILWLAEQLGYRSRIRYSQPTTSDCRRRTRASRRRRSGVRFPPPSRSKVSAGRHTENVLPPLLCGQHPVGTGVGANARVPRSVGRPGHRVRRCALTPT
jgi:hypothetical protein